MADFALLIAPLVISFSAGYGLRSYISRRRRREYRRNGRRSI